MNINPGDLIYGQNEGERFQVIRLLGNGSFGIVYEVVDVNTGNHFALKTIVITMLDPIGFKALINEGSLASTIEHENVLRVYYFHDGYKYPHLPPYVLMEYADGGTLEHLIDSRKDKQTFFSNDELRSIYSALASGMKAINEKLVHRDIKPDNILLSNGVLKISDFGLSKVVGALTRTQTFKGVNHRMYCAPEAWLSEKNTPAMDMYSMGIVFYELATLHFPYNVQTMGDISEAWKIAHLTQTPQIPNKLNSSLDTNLTQLLMKMISKRPEDRYPTWDDVIQRIETQDIEPKQQSKVSHLVQKAMERHFFEEQERLKQENELRRQKEYEEIITYCFQEIIRDTQIYIDQFNQASEFKKLELRHIPLFTIDIRQIRGNERRIVITVFPLYQEQKLYNQKIKAWGFVKAPSGRGFNLLLVEANSDDIYGQWITLHVNHIAGARRRDNKPDPFPFDIDDLPKEIEHINHNAMHIYLTDRGVFSTEMLQPLIEELL